MSEPNAPSPRLPKPESLEAKFKLAIALPYDQRAKRKHLLVFGFVLDWFHSTYGNALASVRHVAEKLKERDPTGKGLGRTSINDALADLVTWGWLHQEDGAGRNANRYVPAWEKVCVHPVVDTTDGETCVHPVVDAGVHPVVDTKLDSVHPVADKDPSTRTRPRDRVTGTDGQDCAAPTAPLSAGLSAADAGPAQGGFEELWLAYDFKKKKKEARAAYAKLAPMGALHASMVEAARAWQASWAAQNNPGAPRFHLHKWLEREEYECTPPSAYKLKERRLSERQATGKPHEKGAPYPRRELFTITGSNILKEDGETDLSIDVVDETGNAKDIVFNLECNSEDAQYRGQRQFAKLCGAVGIHTLEDSSQLHGLQFVRVLRGKFEEYEYEPARARREAA